MYYQHESPECIFIKYMKFSYVKLMMIVVRSGALTNGKQYEIDKH